MKVKDIEKLHKAIESCQDFEDNNSELFKLINDNKVEMGTFDPPIDSYDFEQDWINWEFQETKIIILTVLDFIKSNVNPKE